MTRYLPIVTKQELEHSDLYKIAEPPLIKSGAYRLDGAAKPEVPPDHTLLRHEPNEEHFYWHPNRFMLVDEHSSPENFLKMAEALMGLHPSETLNAGIMDQLEKNPQLLPEEWNPYMLLFAGTMFLRYDGYECVGVLYRRRGLWTRTYESWKWLAESRPRIICLRKWKWH